METEGLKPDLTESEYPEFNLEKDWGDKAQEYRDALTALDNGEKERVRSFLEGIAQSIDQVAIDSAKISGEKYGEQWRELAGKFRTLIANLESGDLGPVREELKENAEAYQRWAEGASKKSN